MEEEKKDFSAEASMKSEEKSKDCCAAKQKFCYCKALMAILIIIFVWAAPSWANIVITILAVLIVFTSGTCCCAKKKK
jgi:hypothetical protein